MLALTRRDLADKALPCPVRAQFSNLPAAPAVRPNGGEAPMPDIAGAAMAALGVAAMLLDYWRYIRQP
jgi:hypothetical protein